MADGLLLVDKHPGCTSHDVVQQVRRLVGQRRIGHCGTLDPDATGLLLLTLGQATRLTRFLIRAPKEYEGVLRLGAATDTYDAAGRVTATAPTTGLDSERVAQAMRGFVGSYLQNPPPYSAKKAGGVKFYELARRGEEVPEASKEVRVFDFAATAPLAEDLQPFRLACESGTYARSLAHDLGQRLGCGAHLARLRRTAIGPFRVESALAIAALAERLSAGDANPAPAWLAFDEIPLPFGELELDPVQERRIGSGQTVVARDFAGGEGDWVKLVGRRRQFLAVGSVIERLGAGGVAVIQPKIVFGSSSSVLKSTRI